MSAKKPSDTDTHLKDAFELVDKLSNRLDDLKVAYNEGTKEIVELKAEDVSALRPTLPPMTPSPDPPPVAKAVPARESGRYSFKTPAMPFAVEKLDTTGRLPIPRPRPKIRPSPIPPSVDMKKRVSGRFYVEVRLDGSRSMTEVRDKLSQVGRIVDSGTGTAVSPTRAWVEVASTEDMSSVIAKLREIEIREQVEKVVEVLPGEGRLQARQMDLFRTVDSKPSSE